LLFQYIVKQIKVLYKYRRLLGFVREKAFGMWR